MACFTLLARGSNGCVLSAMNPVGQEPRSHPAHREYDLLVHSHSIDGGGDKETGPINAAGGFLTECPYQLRRFFLERVDNILNPSE